MNQNAATPEYVQDLAKVTGLTRTQRQLLCDLGYYNQVIAGYLILAMREAGHSSDEIEKALDGLFRAFDGSTAAEADRAYEDF